MKSSDFPEGYNPLLRPSIPRLLPMDQPAVVCLRSSAYQADERREEHPAELPPAARPVADHVLDVLVKPLRSCGRTSVTAGILATGPSLCAVRADWTESYRKTDDTANIISCCGEGHMLDIMIHFARVSA